MWQQGASAITIVHLFLTLKATSPTTLRAKGITGSVPNTQAADPGMESPSFDVPHCLSLHSNVMNGQQLILFESIVLIASQARVQDIIMADGLESSVETIQLFFCESER